MCVNCVSTAEAAAIQVGLVGALVKAPLHRALARRGLVAAPDVTARDARTLAFLRSLELDPVAVLGPETVAAAEAWVPVPQTAAWRSRWRRTWARPIGSHSLITAQ